ncbi:MAG: 23S rRNA (uracil(1939)-C(5))-methyltransferase RlmD [Clostridia bacterium]|nr:23S rRNA (uracil(1939)-C(5))-methyltransferase RlmD [Clostridia bacterium]
MNKNDIIHLDITDISAEGNGIGKYECMAVFVPKTAVGDSIKARVLKVKKSYAYAKTEEFLYKSENRVKEDCPVFSKCGGCVFRHINYESECSLKENRVYETVKRIGGVDLKPMPIVFSDSLRYRNKAQYPISADGKTGFFATHSHRVAECDDCLLQPEEFSLATKVFEDFIKNHGISVYNENTKLGLLRHLYLRKAEKTGEVMAVVVINGDKLPCCDELVSKFKEIFGSDLKSVLLNINRDDTNVILGDKNILVYGDEYITDILCGIKVRLSAFSFYQVNHKMAELLYEKARQYANPDNKNILDLYCGTGTIGLSMARTARELVGVEIVPQAIEDAKINAKNNGINNARFICSDASDAVKELNQQGFKPDVVILDPPRKGCSKQLLDIVANAFFPEQIVYISCDVATLARDIKILTEYGYKLTEYTPFDLFPRTAHVETVCLLMRENVNGS